MSDPGLRVLARILPNAPVVVPLLSRFTANVDLILLWDPQRLVSELVRDGWGCVLRNVMASVIIGVQKRKLK